MLALAVRRGLFEEHKLLFSFLLCTSILRHPSSGEISEVEWSCLVRGMQTTAATAGLSHQKPRPKPDVLTWLKDDAWTDLHCLEQLVPTLKGLGDSVAGQDTAAWRKW